MELMEQGHTNGWIIEYIQENGRIASFMEKGNLIGQMGDSI